jgi:hypothetical protein
MKKLNIKKIFIFFSFLVFFVSALETNFGYLNNKEYPNGYDNHFSYLIKSVNLKNCFSKNSCSGLKTIENQFIQNQEKQSYNHQIERFSAQIFKIYHVFYSFFIMAVDEIFNDILKSRVVAHLIFLPIIGLSIFLFSQKLFGYKVSCSLLIIYAFNNYHGWGYGSQINPFVLSQSFSMLAFVFLLNSSYLNSSIFSMLCSLTHPIGIFTNLINILFIYLNKHKNSFYKNFIFIGVNFILIIYVYLNKSSFYDEIIIGNSSIFAKDITLIKLMISNVDKFFYAYEPMIKYYGLPLLLCCTFFFITRSKNREFIILIFLIFIMAVGTIILDKPNVTLPQRFMNVTGIILLGSFFYTFAVLITKLKKNFLGLNIETLNFSKINFLKFIKLFSLLPTYFFFIFLFVFLANIAGGIKSHLKYYKYFENNHDVVFSKEQLNSIDKKSVIIFDTFEKVDYFYLLYGAQKNHFLYYDKLGLDQQIFSSKIPKYFVKMSNLYEKLNDSDIFIYENEKVVLNNNSTKQFFIKLDVYKDSQITLNDKLIELKKNFINHKKTYTLQLNSETNTLRVKKGKLKLISYNDSLNFNWPWNKDANLEIYKIDKKYKINFDDSLNKFNNCKSKIVNDDGSSHLFKIFDCKT